MARRCGGQHRDTLFNNLNQLVSFTDAVRNLSAAFEYDRNGNRVKRTSTDGRITQYRYDRCCRWSW